MLIEVTVHFKVTHCSILFVAPGAVRPPPMETFPTPSNFMESFDVLRTIRGKNEVISLFERGSKIKLITSL